MMDLYSSGRKAGSLVILVMVFILTGCASATKSVGMMAQSSPSEKFDTIEGSVAVKIRGGKETSALGTSQISNADLKAAIVSSLANTELFSSVVENSAESVYLLKAAIINLNQPLWGASMTVDIDIAWTLAKIRVETPLIREVHSSTYTAPMGAAFAGVKRLRIATEGAVRENIDWILKRISQLDL